MSKNYVLMIISNQKSVIHLRFQNKCIPNLFRNRKRKEAQAYHFHWESYRWYRCSTLSLGKNKKILTYLDLGNSHCPLILYVYMRWKRVITLRVSSIRSYKRFPQRSPLILLHIHFGFIKVLQTQH